MKKLLCSLLISILLLSLCMPACAAGITIRTTSIFAGSDPAAGSYVELVKDWEAETGNRVDDSSSTSDEAWKAGVLNDFAAGNEPDVLFYFSNTADSVPILSKVVPIREINETYKDLHFVENELMREPDGTIYAIPVRSFWEGLFCNVDLFEQYGLDLPTDWGKLETAIATFKANGIVPIAVSLADIPHYITEFSILSAGSPFEHQYHPAKAADLPASWVEGMRIINRLYELGAFAPDVNATTEAITSQMFRDKRAAMQLDGSWFANSIPQDSWDSTIVMPFPCYGPKAEPTAIIGGVSMGFYISRKAWDDPAKRDVVVSFLTKMTCDASISKLGFFFGGDLLKSARVMVSNAKALCTPIGDTMGLESRNYWYTMVSSIADGSVDPQQIMEEVINRGAYK